MVFNPINFSEEDIKELQGAAISIKSETINLSVPKQGGFKVTDFDPIAIGSVARFATDHGYVFSMLPEKHNGADIYALLPLDKYKQGITDADFVIAVDQKDGVQYIVGTHDLGKGDSFVNKALAQAKQTESMNGQAKALNLETDKVVEAIRTDKSLTNLEKDKLIHFRGITNHIENNLSKEQGNILYYGEYHSKIFDAHTQRLIKEYGADKLGIKEYFSENHVIARTIPSGTDYKIEGVHFGLKEIGEQIRGADKTEKIHALDLANDPNTDGKSDDEMKKRDANFSKVFNANYKPNTNIMVVTGSSHGPVADDLKKKGNVIMFSIHTMEDKNEEAHLKSRGEYTNNNSYNLGVGLTEKAVKSLEIDKNTNDVTFAEYLQTSATAKALYQKYKAIELKANSPDIDKSKGQGRN